MKQFYKNAFTKQIADGTIKKGFSAKLIRTVQRKLTMLATAETLNDLRSPPGNMLEALGNNGKYANRLGQHSIRINGQWRICFIWREGGAEDVEIVDYHNN